MSVLRMQERIMTLPFGEAGETFKSSLFLVLCNRLMTCCVAIACLLVRITLPFPHSWF